MTTPKLPPPPCSAQNRSGCVVRRWRGPLAVGGDELDRDEVVAGQPVVRSSQPEPPPSVSPATPSSRRGRRWSPGRAPGCGVELAQVIPAPARATRRTRVDVDVASGGRRFTIPSSQSTPGDRVAAGADGDRDAGLRACATAAATSSVDAARAISAGRRSTIALNRVRASS